METCPTPVVPGIMIREPKYKKLNVTVADYLNSVINKGEYNSAGENYVVPSNEMLFKKPL